jgi:predicted DNA repair protein MutK
MVNKEQVYLFIFPGYKIDMASGIFTVLDDVAALMDDVAVASKIATRKTAGILGDDLAVNAEKATGFLASRELPVLWAITKGSLLNKLIIVPIALLLTAFLPTAVKIILVFGGLYLSYEGAEKIYEFLFHRKKKGEEVIKQAEQDDRVAEKTKVKSAITTDFILSVEIVIIALGTVLDRELPIQIFTVSIVALLATVGVYGFVALIVRMDDIGFRLIKRSGGNGAVSAFGNILVKSLPIIIKALGVIGTIALILVAGGIFEHNVPFLHHSVPGVPSIVKEFGLGLIVGFLTLALVAGIKKIFKKKGQTE